MQQTKQTANGPHKMNTPGSVDLPWPTDTTDADVQSPSGDIEEMNNRSVNPDDAPDADINATDEQLIRQTLRNIMESELAPAAAKAQAARTLAEMAQLLGRHQREAIDTGTPVKELTRAALEAELQAEISAQSD